jgi:hypothetical protein
VECALEASVGPDLQHVCVQWNGTKQRTQHEFDTRGEICPLWWYSFVCGCAAPYSSCVALLGAHYVARSLAHTRTTEHPAILPTHLQC